MPRSCSCSFPVRNQRARARSCAALSRASAGVVRSAALRAHSDVAVSPSNCPAPVRPAHPMGSQQSDSSSGNAAHGALDKERNNPALPFCTRAELRRHRTATDCWMAIHGLVFNVTGLIPSHPGGSELLLSSAGKDASEEFEEAFHPDYVIEDEMMRYLVARLATNESGGTAAAASPSASPAPTSSASPAGSESSVSPPAPQ